MGKQIASALACAHAAGVIHPEIKPASVLLERAEGGAWRAKLTGFTMAKACADIDCAAPIVTRDLYSLGVLLFEMLTGRPPRPSATGQSSARQDACSCPPHVRDLRPGIPPEVDALVAGLLGARRDDQPASALAVHQGLTDIGARRPVVHTPPPSRGLDETSLDRYRGSTASRPGTRRPVIWVRRFRSWLVTP
jgi:serine/threonine protein kinase